MNIAEHQISLIQYIMNLNETDKIKRLIDFISSEDINFIAWDVQGNSYSQSKYQEAMEAADKSISNGEFKTTDELRNKYLQG